MSETLDLVYIGRENVRRSAPRLDKRLNNIVQAQGIGRSRFVPSIGAEEIDGKLIYKDVDAMYAKKLVRVSPLLFDFVNAPVKDKNSADLAVGAVTIEELKRREELAERDRLKAIKAQKTAEIAQEAARKALRSAQEAKVMAKKKAVEVAASEREQKKARQKAIAEGVIPGGPPMTEAENPAAVDDNEAFTSVAVPEAPEGAPGAATEPALPEADVIPTNPE